MSSSVRYRIVVFICLALSACLGCSRLNELEKRMSDMERNLEQLNRQVVLVSELLSNKYFIQNVVSYNGGGYKLVLVIPRSMRCLNVRTVKMVKMGPRLQ